MSFSTTLSKLVKSIATSTTDSELPLDLMIGLGLFALAFALYGSSLHYPFFWDDPVELERAQTRSIITAFTDSRDYLYYRPLTFTLWKFLSAFRGQLDPLVFHSFQAITHALNGCLTYFLAQRLTGRRPVGAMTAILFATYPFSYQATTWVEVPQVQVTALLLAALIAYHDGRRCGKNTLLWGSLFLITLALFMHESAATFGVIIAALDLMIRQRKRPLRSRMLDWWPFPLSHLLVCAVFVALWPLIPKDASTLDLRFEPAVGGYLLQGLIWSVAGAMGQWQARLPNPPWCALIIAAFITLGWMYLAYRRGRRLPLLGLSLLWFTLPLIPVWTTRGFDYVGIAPRLFYVSAPAAALAWGGLLGLPIQLPWESKREHSSWKIGVVMLIAVVVCQSVAFIAVRNRMYAGAMPAIWDAARWGKREGAESNLLFINAPDRVTSSRLEYPLGDSLVMVMPIAIDIGDYIALHSGVHPETQSLSVPRLAGLNRYPYQVNMRGVIATPDMLTEAIRAADTVFFTEYHSDGTIRIVEAGSLFDAPQPSPSLATFGEVLQLHKATLKPSGQLILHWTCLQPGKPGDTIFVHVAANKNEPPVAQADGDPLHGLWPVEYCRPGEQIRDVRNLPLDSVPTGRYNILLGMYNRATGKRLSARDGMGKGISQNSVVVATWRQQ